MESIDNIFSDLDQKKRNKVIIEVYKLPMEYRQRIFQEFVRNPDKPILLNTRKHLSYDAINMKIRKDFNRIEDTFSTRSKISLGDALMSAYAMFSLKYPSLLDFDSHLNCIEEKIRIQNTFRIKDVPSDTQMRVRLDVIDPSELRLAFNTVFREAQRGKLLEKFAYHDGYYIISLDGTGFFSSQKLGFDYCIKKVSKKNGETTYQLQMLGACIVHPDYREVIPLVPEPICNKDGQKKNDCERNSFKRWIVKFREDHPNLKVILTEDALFANAPHIRLLKKHNCSFMIIAKEKDNTWLFDSMKDCVSQNKHITHEMIDPNNPDIKHKFTIYNGLSLNKSNQDVIVNVLEYWEENQKTGKIRHFCWITDLKITAKNAYKLMRAGRSKWKIENETFNTLKNQGYNLEHNYGLGKKHLAFVFVNLMMLAFLVDQIQQISCPLFKAAYFISGSKRVLWEDVRGVFNHMIIPTSMTMLYNQIIIRIIWKLRLEYLLQNDP